MIAFPWLWKVITYRSSTAHPLGDLKVQWHSEHHLEQTSVDLQAAAPISQTYPKLRSTLQRHNRKRRNSVAVVEHAERQQRVAGPPFLDHHEEHQRECCGDEVDWYLRVAPRDFVAAQLQGKEHEDQECGEERRAQEVDSEDFLGFRCFGLVLWLGVWQ